LAEIDIKYSNSQVLIIPITTNYGDSTNDLNIWKQDYNQNWNIVRDDITSSYSTPFNIAYVPTTIILDQDGNIVKEMVGPEEGSYINIKAEIDSLL